MLSLTWLVCGLEVCCPILFHHLIDLLILRLSTTIRKSALRNAHREWHTGVVCGTALPGIAQAMQCQVIFVRGLLLASLGSFLGTVAGDLLSKFNNDAVVNDTIHRCSCGHRVFENLFPLGKDQVGCNDNTAPFLGMLGAFGTITDYASFEAVCSNSAISMFSLC